MNNQKLINKNWIFLAVAFQLLLVFSTKVVKDISLRNARKIVVKTIPVDPRDIFRGDYVMLRYNFSRIDLSKIKKHGEYFSFSNREKVYVLLSKATGEWEPVEISKRRFENPTSAGRIILKGVVSNLIYNSDECRGIVFGECKEKGVIEVKYGIESYFVPEGEGRHIEKMIAKKILTVELAVDKNGNASARKIFIDGKEVEFR